MGGDIPSHEIMINALSALKPHSKVEKRHTTKKNILTHALVMMMQSKTSLGTWFSVSDMK